MSVFRIEWLSFTDGLVSTEKQLSVVDIPCAAVDHGGAAFAW